MARYTVHLPPGDAALERAVFVRDGFSFAAFYFGPFWLLAKGAWISASLVLAGMVGLLVLISILGVTSGYLLIALMLVQLLLALEGSSLRRWELTRRGWQEAGLVVGSDRDSLERRFFEQMQPAAPDAPRSGEIPSPIGANAAAQPQVLGLFPHAGRSR